MGLASSGTAKGMDSTKIEKQECFNHLHIVNYSNAVSEPDGREVSKGDSLV
jgi:hypothetical protein